MSHKEIAVRRNQRNYACDEESCGVATDSEKALVLWSLHPEVARLGVFLQDSQHRQNDFNFVICYDNKGDSHIHHPFFIRNLLKDLVH